MTEARSKPTLKRLTAQIVTVMGATPATINPCVNLPEKIVAALRAESGKNQSIPVRATLQGKPFRANVMRYRGAWRLYLNGVIRKTAGVDVGDRAGVTVRYDPAPRVHPVPPAFAKALKANPKASARFASFSPSRRKEILRYLGSLKRQDSLARNTERTLRYLTGRATGVSPTGLYRVEALKRRPKGKFRAK
ncbi:MAG TPA: YdeI/OmpD-associated family protein [Gammaproteobacteria bacterium]|nr:YdeI/OmpD-associated family protein [Gammaproteobacteria bacterium]